MKTDFKFANLCGSAYKKGNLLYTPDGNSIISPVGNRVSVFDLVNNKSETLPVQSFHDINFMAMSPSGQLLLVVDRRGYANLISMTRKILIAQFRVDQDSVAAQFSPDGRYFAVAGRLVVSVRKTPSLDRQYSPLEVYAVTLPHRNDITSIQWTADSRHLLTTSEDRTVGFYTLPDRAQPLKPMAGVWMGGHTDTPIAAFMSPDGTTLYSVGRDRKLVRRQCRDLDNKVALTLDDMAQGHVGSWRKMGEERFDQCKGRVTAATYHPNTQLLVVGFDDGLFGLWEMPDFNSIHMLNISKFPISTVAINPTGEWIALGSEEQGQLLVWEWQSETYVFKQQGHSFDMNAVAYSPDGQYLATCDDLGKIKIWNTTSGYCFVTFSEHQSSVTALTFTKNGQVIVSASLDGTVRAYDLVRYRNFRTFTTPEPVQFSSLAVDASGEIVCAGSQDNFEISVWSMQTGKLLDVLNGHEGPVSSLAFHPGGQVLASASWDKTVKLWHLLNRDRAVESLRHGREVLVVTYRPDGEQLATSTLDGQIHFWNIEFANQTGSIEGQRDLVSGKAINDFGSVTDMYKHKYFTSLCYSTDGSAILGGGRSNYICLYDTQTAVLIRRFPITASKEYDGTQTRLRRDQLSEAGPMALIDDESDEETDRHGRRIKDKSLPGVQKGDLSRRTVRPEVRTHDVKFSPTGRAWAAASTEGLLVYSLDDTWIFDPFDLDLHVTPASVLESLDQGEYLTALIMAFRLNEKALMVKVYENIPPTDVPILARDFPEAYLDRMLHFIAVHAEENPHLEFHMLWVSSLLRDHGRFIKRHSTRLQPVLRNILKAITRIQQDLSKM
ncbi:WD40-repeat-containing domain protein [Dimargaris cristalligena]|uniref:WD40-repeat-containing domain protein n=1 Tax=Dimargaris cristalligena TaxID=215637 RepID=A0A4P9ZSD9_9FUNG|nr:WD40-repeat-containing domain protein [Dimargaris cristalligena]|eukprot:RKP36347.1 WD40-repeat-containing domain protein [Dimargaris cristalligena]